MKRKVIKQGHDTLTVTLPSQWAKRFNLRAGNEVELTEKENGLFISVEKLGEEKRAEFDITDMDVQTIWKHFMAVYREGYSEVKVKFDPSMKLENPYKYFSRHSLDLQYLKYKGEVDKKPIVELLQGFANRFIGFEIIEHGRDYILIKEMGEITSKEFDNSLRRVFLLLQQMADETLEAIKTQNPELISHMHEVDLNVDKFHDYAIRVLNRAANKEPRKTTLLFSTLFLLELIGDEFKAISHHFMSDLKNKKHKSIEKTAELIKEQMDLFYDLFYKYDKNKIEPLAKRDFRIYDDMRNAYNSATEEEKKALHHFRVASRLMNSLLELRIEMEF